MDELQDAIEDAQYMNAMHDDLPTPTQTFNFLSDEEYDEFLEHLRSTESDLFDLQTFSRHILGLFLFLKHCREWGDTHFAWFVMETCRYRAAYGKYRRERAEYIFNTFLVDGAPNDIPRPEDSYQLSRKRSNVEIDSVASLYEETVAVPEGSRGGLDPRTLPPIKDEEDDEANGKKKKKKKEKEPTPEELEAQKQAEEEAKRIEQEKEAFINVLDLPNPIGLVGSAVEQLRATIFASEEKEAEEKDQEGNEKKKEEGDDSTHERSHRKHLSSHIFDTLEAVVMYHLQQRHWDRFQTSLWFRRFFDHLHAQRAPVDEDEFGLFRVLGRGGFGLVHGCKHVTTGKLYAMKVMNKRRVKMKRSEELCRNERKVLMLVNSPFITNLAYAFTTEEDLVLLLDLMTGGDLGFHLSIRRTFHPHEARYFAGRTLLALHHLHSNRVIYRDLKPENVLMDDTGRTRISDLGLACKNSSHGVTGTCGTRGYWAPEMLRRDEEGKRVRYNHMVDWFSFGCMLYEFMVGTSPFRTSRAKAWGGYERKDRDKAIDKAILEMEPEYNDKFDEHARDICDRLLDKDPSTRLGVNGVEEIMDHPWFAELDWDEMKADRTPPPFVPKRDINAASQAEIGQFQDDYSRKTELTEEDHQIYANWNYTNSKMYQSEIAEFMTLEEEHGPIEPIIYDYGCCLIL